MISVRELALEQGLFKITQRWRHALHALAELHKVLVDRVFGEAGSQEPRHEMPEIPAIEGKLLNIVPMEHLSQIMGDEFIRYGFPWRQLQMPLSMPEIIRSPVRCRLLG